MEKHAKVTCYGLFIRNIKRFSADIHGSRGHSKPGHVEFFSTTTTTQWSWSKIFKVEIPPGKLSLPHTAGGWTAPEIGFMQLHECTARQCTTGMFVLCKNPFKK